MTAGFTQWTRPQDVCGCLIIKLEHVRQEIRACPQKPQADQTTELSGISTRGKISTAEVEETHRRFEPKAELKHHPRRLWASPQQKRMRRKVLMVYAKPKPYNLYLLILMPQTEVQSVKK